ncbi:ABC transporter permease [Nesterenkonia muleiensis]|uniref:ABC transporter permease n=1 Tax=Nesterenkonia muleiensis TaxID=2282648 RepID=UPI000E75CA91|nr:FtsX family ABC transporter permease [Nesterenkonia muleiensis]
MRGNPVLRTNLRSGGKRLWAAGAAVVISVTFVVSALVLIGSFNRTMEAQAEADAAGADLVIGTGAFAWAEAPDGSDDGSGPGPDQELAEAVSELEGVAEAEALSHVFLEGEAAGMNLMLLAGSLPETRTIDIAEGSMPEQEGEILLAKEFAEAYDLGVGDTMPVNTERYNAETDTVEQDSAELTVSGLAGGTHRSVSGYLTPEGLGALDADHSPSSLRVALAGDAHGDPQAQEELQQQVAELIASMVERGELPADPAETEGGAPEILTQPDGSLLVAGVEIHTHQQIIDAWIAEHAGQSTVLVSIGLGFGAIAVFVASLVISNTFQVLVASRSRTMALLRAVGATAGQLRRATVAEGALLGLLGGVLGVLLGWSAASGIAFAAQRLWQESFASAELSVLAIAAGLTLGVLVTVLAAVMPALKAGRTSPMEALRPVEVASDQRRIAWVRTVLGILFAAGGLGGVLLAAVLHAPMIGATGAVVGFSGVLLMGRVLVPAVVSFLGRLVAALPQLRVPGRLAAQNARAVPRRTAVTTSALLIGVTLVSTMTMGAMTAQHSLSDELAERNPVDASLGTASEQTEQVLEESPTVVGHQQLPGAEATLDSEGIEAGSVEGRVILAEESAIEEIARSESVFQEEHSGGPVALISPDLLEAGMAESAEVTLTPHGTAESGALGAAITVTAAPASWVPADTVVLPEVLADTAELWSFESSAAMTVLRISESASMGDLTRLGNEVEASAGEVSLDAAMDRASYTQVIDTVLVVVLVLLAASVLVSVVGVSNTLALSVFERRREAALLRAMGMTRGSVGAMVTLEALLMAAVALVLGSGLGALFAWGGVSSLVARDDVTMVLSIPWDRMGMIWGVTFLAAALASFLPARALSRTPPAAGLSAQ